MEQLAYIAMILLLGSLCSALAYKLRVSNVFLLVFVGIILGTFDIIKFSQEFILTISTLAVILVLFNKTSKLRFKEITKYSPRALRLAFLFLLFCALGMGFISYTSLGLNSVVLALLFAVLAFGIEPEASFENTDMKKNKVESILEIESLINTPLTIIISLALLTVLLAEDMPSAFVQGSFVLKQIVLGIVIGLVIGLIISKILESFDLGQTKHLMLLTAAIISYVASELFGGSGILAVATFGLVFGNSKVQHKLEMEKYASVFGSALRILVFVLIGTSFEINPEFALIGTALFVAYLAIRFLAVLFAIESLGFKERLFMTINVPKGIDVAVLALILSTHVSKVNGLYEITNILVIFILYSVVLNGISSGFTKRMLKSQ